jgi:hypothetical protein
MNKVLLRMNLLLTLLSLPHLNLPMPQARKEHRARSPSASRFEELQPAALRQQGLARTN